MSAEAMWGLYERWQAGDPAAVAEVGERLPALLTENAALRQRLQRARQALVEPSHYLPPIIAEIDAVLRQEATPTPEPEGIDDPAECRMCEILAPLPGAPRQEGGQ